MSHCSRCGAVLASEAESTAAQEALCPACANGPCETAGRLGNRLSLKWLAAGALALWFAACLGRECGLYQFSAMHHNVKLETEYSTNRRAPRPPLQVIRWEPLGDDVQLIYEDGTRGLLTVERVNCSGWSWLPLYKRFQLDVEATLRSDDGLLTGTSTGTAQATLWGVCSSHQARNTARVAVLNQMCQSFSQRRQ